MLLVRNLSKRYEARLVLEDVSFRVASGESLALVGGSGSGKTTTLKIINRLIEPSAGSVELEGRDTRELEPHVLRRRIGYVFQGVGLFPHMTVAENIAVTPGLLGWRREKKEERVEALLELVELDAALAHRYPHELSGGQCQRVGVARALAAEPQLMLFDEPFAALDPITRDRLQQTFVRLKRELRFTSVFVTHDMSEAMAISDLIGVMRDGRLVQLGKPHELVAAPKDEYVERLLDTPRRQAAAFERALRGAAP
jgi:osmoprotectant transport system ATP-binding protein